MHFFNKSVFLIIFALITFAFVACDEPSSAGDDSSDIGAFSSDSGQKGDGKYSSSSSGDNSAAVVDPSSVIQTVITDERDGHTYRVVKIGDQVWMAENMRLEYDVGFASTRCFTGHENPCSRYGMLYTWKAAADYGLVYSNASEDCAVEVPKECTTGKQIRGICPLGWHLPDTTEWETLINSVGGTKNINALRSKVDWGINGTDDYGFTALPGASAYYDDGTYIASFGPTADFWTKVQDLGIRIRNYDPEKAYYPGYEPDIDYQSISSIDYEYVRCIMDDTTTISWDVQSSSSYVPYVQSSASGGLYESVYDASTNTLTDMRDGHVYKTVTITVGDSSTVWMAENLNYSLLRWTYDEDSSTFCYDNNPDYCDKYGHLYSVGVAKDSMNMFDQDICPKGWRLPALKDLKFIFTDDTSDFAGMVKSTTGWPDGSNGTDDFGLSLLPAGYRNLRGNAESGFKPIYEGVDESAYFWVHIPDLSYIQWKGETPCAFAVKKNDFAQFKYRAVIDSIFAEGHAYSIRCVKK